MRLRQAVWAQLKNKTADELCAALQKDGWEWDATRGSERVYRHYTGRRVSIHYHAHKSYGPKLLRGLIAGTGWTEDDMRRLKLIK